MSAPSIELTRRRLVGTALAVGAAGAASGAGTLAAFSDADQRVGDVVAGTIELSFGDSGTFAFSTSLGPTDSVSDAVTLVNTGTIPGSVDVSVSYTESDATGAPAPDVSADEVAAHLEVTTLTYGGTDLTGQVDAEASTPTLADLATNGKERGEETADDLVDLADPADGTDFAVAFRLQDVSDDYQGDGVAVQFTVTLNQTDGM